MATRGRSLTEKQLNDAVAGKHYINADGKSSKLQLSGAIKRWQKAGHENDVYLQGYRLAGSEEGVRNVLRATGVSDDDIQLHINAAYSAANIDQKRPEFDAEVAEATRFKEANKGQKKETKTPTIRLADVAGVLEAIRAGRLANKKTRTPRAPGAATTKKAGGGTPGRGGPRKSALDRIKGLAADKVLDVSKMEEDGTGARAANAPKGVTKRIGVPGLPVISDNAENYHRFVRMLGPGYEQYSEQYRALAAGGGGVLAAVPVAGTRAAPTVRAPSPANRATVKAPTVAAPKVGGAALKPMPTLKFTKKPTPKAGN